MDPELVLGEAAARLIERAEPSADCAGEVVPAPAGAGLVGLDVARVVGGCFTVETEYLPADAVSPRRDELAADPSVVAASVTPDSVLLESDDLREKQWGLDALGAAPGWSQVPWPDGAGTVVAIVDSGVDATNPDLAGAVAVRRHFATEDPDRLDPYGHGTHVAGIVAARAGNGGTVGVAPAASLLDVPVKVMSPDGSWINEGAGTPPGGIEWAVNHGADVINLSLGYPLRDESGNLNEDDELEAFFAALYFAERHDVVVVAGGGNCGEPDMCPRQDATMFPAVYPSVLAVASMNDELRPDPGTTLNDTIDLMAPGEDILSTWPAGVDFAEDSVGKELDDGVHAYDSGSSMAAPFVAGAAAVLRSANPDSTAEQVSAALLDTAIGMIHPQDEEGTGEGMVDIVRAVESVEWTDPPEPSDVPPTRAAFVEGDMLFVLEDGVAHPVHPVDVTTELSLDWSADGESLVGANDGALFTWRGPRIPPVEVDCPDCVATYVDTPDGTGYVVVLTRDGRIRRLPPDTLQGGGTATMQLPGPDLPYRLEGDVNGLLLVGHPRDPTSAYGGPDTLWLVDPVTGDARTSFDPAGRPNVGISSVAVSADGTQVAATSGTHGFECDHITQVHLLDATDLTETAAPEPPHLPETGQVSVHDLFFNGDHLYAVMSTKTWDQQAGTCLDATPPSLWRLDGDRWQVIDQGPIGAVRPIEGMTSPSGQAELVVDQAGDIRLGPVPTPPPSGPVRNVELGGPLQRVWNSDSLWSTPTQTEVDLSAQ